ncbi:MAG: ABC transporter ATP-binding protein [Desulfobacterales bacterium]|nr:ABC transporter ATP-binding protein [Desulfobacterales bacterium]
MKPVLNMDCVSFTYPGSSVPALSDLSLSMDTCECVCISGSTGCGKTTLLMAVQGLLKDGDRHGSISIHPVLPGLNSGMVFQNAETQILCSTVEDEAAFWPENCGMSADDIRLAVSDALDAVGLAGLQNRNVEALSAGQKHRLTIASVL